MGNTNGRPRRIAASTTVPLLLMLAAAACGRGEARAAHVSFGCGEGQRVALTFDDGPNPPFTEQILAVLQSHNAVATFFVEGQAAESSPDIVKREVAFGMAVGSHSYAHATDLATMPRADFARDLEQAEAVLTPLLGHQSTLYRAPYGRTSTVMLASLHDAGYTSIGWDLDSADWKLDVSADVVVENVITQAHPGAIVLMHDGGLGSGNPDRSATVAALPRIIDGLRARGYSFATVPDLIGQPAARGGERRPVCSAN